VAGSSHSGQDIEAGRTNRAERYTAIWAQAEQGSNFDGDAIFIVQAAGDTEDDDFANATTKLHAIVGSGVFDGAGVIGVSESGPDAGVPNVSKVGVFGKGATGVGGEGSPGIEGLGVLLPPLDALSGSGVLGRGARRRETPEEASRPHAPGVVGLGGSPPRDVPAGVTERVAGGAGVFGQGAAGTGDRKPGAGVLGRGGAVPGGALAAGVVGLSSGVAYIEIPVFDTGVLGSGSTGVTGFGDAGPGVRGVGGPGGALTEARPDALQPGVLGQSGSALSPESRIYGAGVIGLAGEPRSFPYAEAGETGVFGTGRTGVKGVGSGGRGGVFESGTSAQLQLVPTLGPRIVDQEALIPTVAAEPGRLGPPLPRAGQGGDLLATRDDQGQCTLWFCVRGATGTDPARWTQVVLGPVFDGRG
jgi:hypothetical protein